MSRNASAPWFWEARQAWYTNLDDTFLDQPQTSRADAEAYLLSYAPFIRDRHDLEAVLHFRDGWYWGMKNSRQHARQVQIDAMVAKRRQEEAEAWRRRWPGHSP